MWDFWRLWTLMHFVEFELGSEISWKSGVLSFIPHKFTSCLLHISSL